MPQTITRIRIVYSTTDYGDKVMGHVIGDTEEYDIRAYYRDHGGYSLVIRDIEPVSIPDGYADKLDALLTKKVQLEKELRALNESINGRKVS